MPLFKKGFRQAWADAGADREDEFAQVMKFPPVPELAVELMTAFGASGPRQGKPLTESDLAQWWLDRYEFTSRRQKVLCSAMLRRGRSPIREALQVLEHAELVYLTVRTDREDNWRATNLGSSILAEGRDAVAERVGQRPGAGAATPTAEPKSAVDRLQELDTLLRAGVISDAEYAAKRQHIIDGI
ncbi:SHOCT domain-containing protein [Mycobacterium sp. EPa45]|uniref:SHOCT domain-containing protein n=1 Tax=Mycobacterium sp. EPa45 TaxID=1545728 RepID=UPI0006418B64|nr:SHOCT domain-containing protein [Mycobacterium sp. EPa45]AKK26012.1 hypothetical protein AB431_04065 [Mycobacterium sp. EPa45]